MIIVFTLILLAVFLTTALSFSYFIIGDINKARAIDDSVIAYYAADAGMEESLYLLQKQEIADSLDGLKDIRAAGGNLPASLGAWNIGESTNFEKTVLRQRLYNGQSAKLFILNRATANQANSITVEWYKGAGTDPRLQVILTQLTPQTQDGTLIYYTDASELEVTDSKANGFVTTYDLKDLDLSGGNLAGRTDYLVELKVLGVAGDFVDRLSVKAYDKKKGDLDYNDSFNSQGITNLTLKSKGSYGKATQNIVAQILPQDPVSGILSFVLFSEQDVAKE